MRNPTNLIQKAKYIEKELLSRLEALLKKLNSYVLPEAETAAAYSSKIYNVPADPGGVAKLENLKEIITASQTAIAEVFDILQTIYLQTDCDDLLKEMKIKLEGFLVSKDLLEVIQDHINDSSNYYERYKLYQAVQDHADYLKFIQLIKFIEISINVITTIKENLHKEETIEWKESLGSLLEAIVKLNEKKKKEKKKEKKIIDSSDVELQETISKIDMVLVTLKTISDQLQILPWIGCQEEFNKFYSSVEDPRGIVKFEKLKNTVEQNSFLTYFSDILNGLKKVYEEHSFTPLLQSIADNLHKLSNEFVAGHWDSLLSDINEYIETSDIFHGTKAYIKVQKNNGYKDLLKLIHFVNVCVDEISILKTKIINCDYIEASTLRSSLSKIEISLTNENIVITKYHQNNENELSIINLLLKLFYVVHTSNANNPHFRYVDKWDFLKALENVVIFTEDYKDKVQQLKQNFDSWLELVKNKRATVSDDQLEEVRKKLILSASFTLPPDLPKETTTPDSLTKITKNFINNNFLFFAGKRNILTHELRKFLNQEPLLTLYEQQFTNDVSYNLFKYAERFVCSLADNVIDSNPASELLIMIAVLIGDIEFLEKFLPRRNMHLNFNLRGMTPLHLACEFDRLSMVDCLLENGADINAKDKKDRTPLHLTLLQETVNVRLLEILLQQTSLNRELTHKGLTPLAIATKNMRSYSNGRYFSDASIRVLKLLLIYGCNFNALNQYPTLNFEFGNGSGKLEKILHWVAYLGLVEIAQLLLDKKLIKREALTEECQGYSLLQLAIMASRYDAVEFFLKQPEICSNLRLNKSLLSFDYKITSFESKSDKYESECEIYDYFKIIIFLMSKSKTIDSDIINDLILWFVSPPKSLDGSLRFDLLTNLIEKVPDEVRNRSNLLHKIICNKMHWMSYVIEILLQLGISCNSKDLSGNTPLHEASKRGEIDVVDLLLQQLEIDINAQNVKGETPLHSAVANKQIQIVARLLQEKNINLCLENYDGKLPFDAKQMIHYLKYLNKSELTQIMDIWLNNKEFMSNYGELLMQVLQETEIDKFDDVIQLMLLGMNFAKGFLVERSFIIAFKYYQRALSQMEIMKGQLTPEEFQQKSHWIIDQFRNLLEEQIQNFPKRYVTYWDPKKPNILEVIIGFSQKLKGEESFLQSRLDENTLNSAIDLNALVFDLLRLKSENPSATAIDFLLCKVQVKLLDILSEEFGMKLESTDSTEPTEIKESSGYTFQ